MGDNQLINFYRWYKWQRKIRNIEIAANKNQVDKNQVFKIYKQIPFELNTLINAKNIYQSLEKIEGRALLYQKFLLSDNIQNKLDLLFLLKDLFKKDNLSNVYAEFLSDRLKEFEKSEIPENYQYCRKKHIFKYKITQQKIKFDEKVLHRSKLIRYLRQRVSIKNPKELTASSKDKKK